MYRDRRRDRWLKVEALSVMAEESYILQLDAGRLRQNEKTCSSETQAEFCYTDWNLPQLF